ncbi:MAG: DUF547 domain-containing protein [Halobacteriovoraceae bacterium]|nr:DUF547 domain-containing protein [Halobacteriovoraceae bacterium]
MFFKIQRRGKFSLLLAMLVTLNMGLSSCSKSEGEPFTAPAAPKKETNQLTEEKGITILTPESELSDRDYLSANLFTLWETFFQSFVAKVSESPLDTRVDFKNMHILREQKDEDFQSLVNAIEKKMTSFDIIGSSKATQAAFYINAYNYTGLRLINKGYIKKEKIIDSIRDLSSTPINPYEILTRETVAFKTGITSMDEIIKEKLKPLYSERGKVKDARFMMALNGGMLGRSFLYNHAFTPLKLEEQLNFVTQNALKLKRMANLDKRTLKLARHFKWYKEYFEESAGSLENFVRDGGFDPDSFDNVKYQDFDWALNDIASFAGRVLEETGTVEPLPQGGTGSTLDDDGKEEDDQPASGDDLPQGDRVDFGTACDYLKSEKVSVLGVCNRVLDGRMDGFYKYKSEVVDATICVISRKLEDDKVSLGAIGSIIEVPEKTGQRESLSIEVEDKAKVKDDKLTIRKAEGVRTKLEYLKTDKRLMVRQTSIIAGRGYRKFTLQCQ